MAFEVVNNGLTRRCGPGAATVTALLLCSVIDAEAACEGEVRLNQVGLYATGTKLAVVSAGGDTPRDWALVDAEGDVVARGETRVFGYDPISGEHVHHVDFSAFEQPGEGFRIVSGCAASHAFAIGAQPYGRLKYDALSFFYHNRSGLPIETAYAGGEAWQRPAGHAPDRATCRAGRDGRGNDWPGCDYTLDVTGGWYDAGDHGKYVVNGGISVWTLLNLYERQRLLGKDDPFADGLHAIPEAGNGVSDLLDEARYQLEFLLRMQAPDGATARVPVDVARNREGLQFTSIDASGMAHHKVADENWTPLPMRPHLAEERRVLHPVSTAATLNLAATAAQCARIWRVIDEAFADRCLAAAERAHAAAERNPRVYFIADFPGSGMYGDTNLSDEFFWAAAELFVTTGDPAYAEALRASEYFGAALDREPAWPRVAPLGIISLALAPDALPERDRHRLRQRIIAAADIFRAESSRSGYRIPYATDSYPWGSNSSVLNRAILLALAYDFTGDRVYRDAVIDAMDYVLGRNPLDQSYVSGYGERPMRHPHHRFWAPSLDDSLPPPPPGVLSGGPNSTNPADRVARELIEAGCAPQTCWRDHVEAYALNEVAINWNAPLVWVAAFLDEPIGGPIAPSADEGPHGR
jgi:endoglucanase